MQKKMVVLANSRKCGGYCLAGKALDAAGHVVGWVRPVIGTTADGVPRSRTVCSDGRQVAILDIVALEYGPPAPALHQRENRLMGPAALRRCGRVTWEELAILADDASSGLWIDGHSSHCGLNDRVPKSRLPELSGSLQLVAPANVLVYRKPGFGDQVKHRAEFHVGQRRYNLALTDAVATLWLKGAHQLALSDAYVCVSLAVPFHDGFAYKLATAVITKDRAEGRI